MRIILSLFFALWSAEAYGSVYFVTDNNRISFADSSQSYGCGNGWHLLNSKCVKNICAAETYPFSTKPDETIGTLISCQSGDDKHYGFSSCNDGWEIKNGNCEIRDCSGYPYTAIPDTAAGAVTSCRSGANIFYTYNSCNSGWEGSAGWCEPNTCEGYPFLTSPDTSIGTASASTCKSGIITKYKYASCKTGWDLNDGACDVHICDSATYFANNCVANAVCSTCYSGGNIKYASPVCNADYELLDGVCVESCKYTATSAPANCVATDSCKKGTSTFYGCKNCNSGWYVDASNTCAANTCEGYGASGTGCNASFGTMTETCQSGNTTHCNYSGCGDDYKLSGTACVDKCSYSVNSMWTSINNCSERASCVKGGTTYYGCARCNLGYYPNDTYSTCTKFATCKAANYKTTLECSETNGNMTAYCEDSSKLYCSYDSCNNGNVLSDGKCICPTSGLVDSGIYVNKDETNHMAEKGNTYVGGYVHPELNYVQHNCDSTHGTLSNYCKHYKYTSWGTPNIYSAYSTKGLANFSEQCTFSSCNPPYVYNNGKCTCANSTSWPSYYPNVLEGNRKYWDIKSWYLTDRVEPIINEYGVVSESCSYGDKAYVKFSSCSDGRVLDPVSGRCLCDASYNVQSSWFYYGLLGGANFEMCDDGCMYNEACNERTDGYSGYWAKINGWRISIKSTQTFGNYKVSNLFCNTSTGGKCEQTGINASAATLFCSQNGGHLPSYNEAYELLQNADFRAFYREQGGPQQFVGNDVAIIQTTDKSASATYGTKTVYKYVEARYIDGNIVRYTVDRTIRGEWDWQNGFTFVCIMDNQESSPRER